MIAIIDYEAGNLTSVERALNHLGILCKITAHAEEILASERVIFPGVGAAGKSMDVIRSKKLDRVICEVIQAQKPFLGICLGAQIVLGRSEEDHAECLDEISGVARKFPSMGLKVPHMGWNGIMTLKGNLFRNIREGSFTYFVHSYYAPLCEKSAAVTSYGIPFSAALWHDNFFGCQFHPEK